MSKGPSTRIKSATNKGLSIYVGTTVGQYGPRPFFGIHASYFDKESKEWKRKELLDANDLAHLMTMIPQALGCVGPLLTNAKAEMAAESPGSEAVSQSTTVEQDEIPF